MIIRDKTDPKIERRKESLGLTGDVYIDEDHHIENLDSHRKLLSLYQYSSMADTIEEAEAERAAFEAELIRRRSDLPELTLEDTMEMLRELGVDTSDQQN